MIQLFAHTRDGRFVSATWSPGDPVPLDSWPEELPGDSLLSECTSAWLDLEGASSEELAWLGRRFRFHPLAIEDCAHFEQLPKIEEYTEHLFLVVHGLAPVTPDCLRIYELHCFLTNPWVVTVHETPEEPIKALRNKIQRDRAALSPQPEFLLHRILDGVMDANPIALRPITEAIETLDEQVLEESSRTQIESIHVIQHQLNQARNILLPQREVFRELLSGEYPAFSERALVYFRDVNDHLLRVIRSVEGLRENMWSIRDAYLAVAAHRTNETMRRLTVFSVIFLPLTFITGFFGMNFTRIPWDNSVLFTFCVALVAVLPLVMILWFSKKDWL